MIFIKCLGWFYHAFSLACTFYHVKTKPKARQLKMVLSKLKTLIKPLDSYGFSFG